MKKIIGLLTLTLLLSGCANKIVCKTNDNSDNNVSMKYIINYKENNATNVTTEKTYLFDNKDEFKNFESYIIYTVKTSNDDNINASYKKKNKKYILTQKYKIDNLSDEILLQNGLKRDKDELVNYLSNSGLTCK